MKIRILKSFWHGEDRYEAGQTADVSNNTAHGLVESGFAEKLEKVVAISQANKRKLKEIEEPPKDKMISRLRRKLRTK